MRQIATALALLLLLGASAVFAQSRDPATLVFKVGGESLQLELGMVDEVRLPGDIPVIQVQLSDKASKMLAQLTGRHIGRLMDVYVCRDKVLSVRVQARISSGQIVIPHNDPNTSHEIADLIFYGNSCDLYLTQ